VVSDKKIPMFNDSGELEYFSADVKAYNSYFPFGMLMPGRHGNTSDYRYGFNGKLTLKRNYLVEVRKIWLV